MQNDVFNNSIRLGPVQIVRGSKLKGGPLECGVPESGDLQSTWEQLLGMV